MKFWIYTLRKKEEKKNDVPELKGLKDVTKKYLDHFRCNKHSAVIL